MYHVFFFQGGDRKRISYQVVGFQRFLFPSSFFPPRKKRVIIDFLGRGGAKDKKNKRCFFSRFLKKKKKKKERKKWLSSHADGPCELEIKPSEGVFMASVEPPQTCPIIISGNGPLLTEGEEQQTCITKMSSPVKDARGL